jgi:hypothetical protein
MINVISIFFHNNLKNKVKFPMEQNEVPKKQKKKLFRKQMEYLKKKTTCIRRIFILMNNEILFEKSSSSSGRRVISLRNNVLSPRKCPSSPQVPQGKRQLLLGTMYFPQGKGSSSPRIIVFQIIII